MVFGTHFRCWCLAIAFSVWSVGLFGSSYADLGQDSNQCCLIGQMRICILSLWEAFDLLQACRIAPEARGDFEVACPSLVGELLRHLSIFVAEESLGDEVSAELQVLYSYFRAMHNSFVGACRGEYRGCEIRLKNLFSALDRLFFALCEVQGSQNDVEIAMPSRLLACVAALQPSA